MDTKTKERAIGIIQELPDNEVSKLLSYLLWLKDKEEWEATMELLSDPETVESISRAKREASRGEFIPLSVVLKG